MTNIDKKWMRMNEIDAWAAFVMYNGDDIWRKAELGGKWKAYQNICEIYKIPEGRYWEND